MCDKITDKITTSKQTLNYVADNVKSTFSEDGFK